MRFLLVLGFCLAPACYAQESVPKIKRVPATSTSATSGKEMFDQYCSACHGADAKGNGPAAPALKKMPTDLTLLARNHGGKFPAGAIRVTLSDVNTPVHGSRDMPVWGPIFSSVSRNDRGGAQLRITNLTNYIQSLQSQ